MADNVYIPEGYQVHVERKPFGIAWAIRAKDFEEAKALWNECEREWGDKPGIRKGKFRQHDDE